MRLVELTTTSQEHTCPLSYYETQHGQSTHRFVIMYTKKQMLTLRHPLQDMCDFVSL